MDSELPQWWLQWKKHWAWLSHLDTAISWIQRLWAPAKRVVPSLVVLGGALWAWIAENWIPLVAASLALIWIGLELIRYRQMRSSLQRGINTFCEATIDVIEIPEFLETQARVRRFEASTSDAGPSHRVSLRLKNTMASPAEFWIQIIGIDDGFIQPPPAPWHPLWRDQPTAMSLPLASGQTRLVDIAEADFMDWRYRKETGSSLDGGAVYFLTHDGSRNRTVLPAHTTRYDFQNALTVTQGNLVVAVGRTKQSGQICGRLKVWFTPEVEEPIVMSLEHEWEFPYECPV